MIVVSRSKTFALIAIAVAATLDFCSLVISVSVPADMSDANIPWPNLIDRLSTKAALEWLVPENHAFTIHRSVLSPAAAGDVVAAVKFAGDHGLELSIKTSGHNYTSTKNDTLHVNMNGYQKYSSTGIVECKTTAKLLELGYKFVINRDLSNQACLFALARGKRAFVRVGGGEAWVDVYKSVRQLNEAGDNYKYHVVGGNDATVSPMEWTFQGGLGGNAASRLYGLGVDQVLQIEAVLPNGQHVRFGPTSWEDQEGLIYPRTTAVSGACNQNPEDAEEDWNWRPCPSDINFDDLWFAFLGGSGGTWGVVTSMYIQLHDWLPIEVLRNYGSCRDQFSLELKKVFTAYLLDYLVDPATLGISHKDSAACGKANDPNLWCYGEGTGVKFASTWQLYLQSITADLLGKGETEESLAFARDCMESTLEFGIKDMPMYDDAFTDQSHAMHQTLEGWYNTLIPVSTYRSAKQDILDFISTDFGIVDELYNSFGGNVPHASDQANSLSQAHRDAAFLIFLDEDQFASFAGGFAKIFGISSNDDEIPGMLSGNHLSPFAYGPRKKDPTKPCNFTSLIEAEAECFSTQEALWGTELYKRLKQIKEEIDPNYMFDCNKCVGNDRHRPVPQPIASTPSPTSVPTDQPTREPTARPTVGPTVRSTSNPTIAPTHRPTINLATDSPQPPPVDTPATDNEETDSSSTIDSPIADEDPDSTDFAPVDPPSIDEDYLDSRTLNPTISPTNSTDYADEGHCHSSIKLAIATMVAAASLLILDTIK